MQTKDYFSLFICFYLIMVYDETYVDIGIFRSESVRGRADNVAGIVVISELAAAVFYPIA